jgi:hypothetical protein
MVCRRGRRRSLIGEKNLAGITVQRGEKVYALPSLRQAERKRVDDSVRPLVASLFERADDDVECSSAGQAQHERNVLEQDPGHGALIEQAKDFVHEPGALSADPRRHPSLAQVLAGKPGGKELDSASHVCKSTNVLLVSHIAEPRVENGGRAVIDFAQQPRFVPRSPKAEFDASDSSKQAGSRKTSRLRPPASMDANGFRVDRQRKLRLVLGARFADLQNSRRRVRPCHTCSLAQYPD